MVGGIYSQQPNLFKELEEIGLYVDKNIRFIRHWLVWDIECALLDQIEKMGPKK